MRIIGLVGFADSGKGTASRVLIEQGWRPVAFADALKDVLAAMFGWSRHLLEGDTDESRVWRERVDPWWATKLNIPHFTPRFAMRHIGTDVLRAHFDNDLWVYRVERTISQMEADIPGVVLTDIRFPNEMALARSIDGRVFRIRRGPEPPWYSMATEANLSNANAKHMMQTLYKVHESEWAWIGAPLDGIIENDGTPADLGRKLLDLVR